MRTRQYYALLVGGEYDGEVVEIVGPVYQYNCYCHFDRSFFTGVYVWQTVNAKTDDYIGRFIGYYKKGKRVDKLGRKLRGLSLPMAIQKAVARIAAKAVKGAKQCRM